MLLCLCKLFFQESKSSSSKLEILVISQKFLVIQDHRITLFSDCVHDEHTYYFKELTDRANALSSRPLGPLSSFNFQRSTDILIFSIQKQKSVPNNIGGLLTFLIAQMIWVCKIRREVAIAFNHLVSTSILFASVFLKLACVL